MIGGHFSFILTRFAGRIHQDAEQHNTRHK